MKRKATILGQVRDVFGSLWDVRDIRDTRHGFDLLLGSQVRRGVYRGGLPRLIATKPLVEFWDSNRTIRDGAMFDLPAGRTTLKRLRRRLGFNSLRDVSTFWRARIGDLKTLSAREFAERHEVNLDVVFDTRYKLLGRTARLPDWWRKPKTLKILQSAITLKEMGEKLGIGTTHAKRLRDRARGAVA